MVAIHLVSFQECVNHRIQLRVRTAHSKKKSTVLSSISKLTMAQSLSPDTDSSVRSASTASTSHNHDDKASALEKLSNTAFDIAAKLQPMAATITGSKSSHNKNN